MWAVHGNAIMLMDVEYNSRSTSAPELFFLLPTKKTGQRSSENSWIFSEDGENV